MFKSQNSSIHSKALAHGPCCPDEKHGETQVNSRNQEPAKSRLNLGHFGQLKSLLQDYDRVTQEFDDYSNVLSYNMMIAVFGTIPCMCLGLFLSIYFTSMPMIRISTLIAVVAVAMTLVAFFIGGSALNAAVCPPQNTQSSDVLNITIWLFIFILRLTNHTRT